MMSAQLCALCDVELTFETASREHIIPNSIGGWRTTNAFICKRCNSVKGGTWDAELAKQFAWFSSMTGIVRDRGEVAPVTVTSASGVRYQLSADGSLRPTDFKFSRVKNEGGVTISMVARTTAEVVKKLRELHATYPKMDLDDTLKKATMTTEYLSEPLKVVLPEGGATVGRAVISTALAFAVENNILPSECEVAFDCLRDSEKALDCYGWSYLEDIVSDRLSHPILHCVAIFGDPITKYLFAYVEFFSYGRWLIKLSGTYQGPSIREHYAIDPATAREIRIELFWDKVLKDFARVIDGDGFDIGKLEAALHPIMAELMQRAWQRSYKKAYDAAVEGGLSAAGVTKDKPLTAESLHLFSQHFMEKMKPLILHSQSSQPIEWSRNDK